MMNEKVNALFTQALDKTVPETYTSLSSEQLEKFADEFATLIIQQAILAVEMKTNTHHVYTSFDEGMVLHTIHNSVKAIKEHLGVEW